MAIYFGYFEGSRKNAIPDASIVNKRETIASGASFSTRALMPSRPVAFFEGILLRSASTISLVISGIQNLSCDEGVVYSVCVMKNCSLFE